MLLADKKRLYSCNCTPYSVLFLKSDVVWYLPSERMKHVHYKKYIMTRHSALQCVITSRLCVKIVSNRTTFSLFQIACEGSVITSAVRNACQKELDCRDFFKWVVWQNIRFEHLSVSEDTKIASWDSFALERWGWWSHCKLQMHASFGLTIYVL